MCGLAGYFTNNPKLKLDFPKLARDLVLGVEHRGRDATGYVAVTGNSTVWAKRPVPASTFVKAAPLFRHKTREEQPLIVGLHTRAATQGWAFKNGNNHPVYSKRTGLLLMHNGWLYNEKSVIEEFDLKKDEHVDTETILRVIEYYLEQGAAMQDAIAGAMEKLSGCFACVLMNTNEPGVVWLWRRDNPLYMYRDERMGLTVWASSFRTIAKALKKAGVRRPKRWRVSIEERELVRLEGDKYDQWEIPDDPFDYGVNKHYTIGSTGVVTGTIDKVGNVQWSKDAQGIPITLNIADLDDDEWEDYLAANPPWGQDDDMPACQAEEDYAELLNPTAQSNWGLQHEASWIDKHVEHRFRDRRYLYCGNGYDPYTGDLLTTQEDLSPVEEQEVQYHGD